MNESTKPIELTQNEYSLLVNVLGSISIKLGDAKILLPLAEKLMAQIDKPVEPEVVNEVKLPNVN